jgi:hypothetical protein
MIYTVVKGKVHQEDVTIINFYAPMLVHPTSQDIKGPDMITVGDFNTTFSLTDT